jgi:hypothetical protein
VTLAAFFEQIGPFLEGREPYSAAAARLYGDPPAPALARDARRLRIYGRFCSLHRHEVIDLVCTETRAQVLALAGEAVWDELIEGYFRAVPMHHAELSANGDGWVDYLAAQALARGLPAWLSELSDLEQSEFRAGVAADDPADALADDPADAPSVAPGQTGGAAGPLRIASTVDLRPYQHDLVAWLDHDPGEGPRPPAPAVQAVAVLFWRDGDLDRRRENASPLELAVLQAVMQGADPLVLAGADAEELREVVEDLKAAGVLLGGA